MKENQRNSKITSWTLLVRYACPLNTSLPGRKVAKMRPAPSLSSSGTCSASNVALQVVLVCCPYYYYLRVQQIFMLQKVGFVSAFFNMKICCSQRWQYEQQIIGTCNATFVAPPVARKYCPYSPLQKLWGDWYE